MADDPTIPIPPANRDTGGNTPDDGGPPPRRRRFRLKRRARAADAPAASPFARTAVWSAATLMLLALVWTYDRRGTGAAAKLAESARAAAVAGHVEDALKLYDRALDAPRLGRARKAEIAIAAGDTCLLTKHDPEGARGYYAIAKRLSPRSVEVPAVAERLRAARIGAANGTAAATPAPTPAQPTTPTPTPITITVRATPYPTSAPAPTLTPAPDPAEVAAGSVLVRWRGGALRAGDIRSAMRDARAGAAPGTRASWNDPAKARALLTDRLDEALAHQAAKDARITDDPEFRTRVDDYARQLAIRRHAEALRAEAFAVTSGSAEAAYRAAGERFRRGARVELAAVKCADLDEASRARAALAAGASFADVASSFSRDRATAPWAGRAGTLRTGDRAVPGVGEAPELAAALLTLRTGDVTTPTAAAGAWWIFRATEAAPAIDLTLEQVRGAIEGELRAERMARLAPAVRRPELRARYAADIDAAAVTEFAHRAAAEAEREDATTTAGTMATAATAGTSGTVPRAGE